MFWVFKGSMSISHVGILSSNFRNESMKGKAHKNAFGNESNPAYRFKKESNVGSTRFRMVNLAGRNNETTNLHFLFDHNRKNYNNLPTFHLE